MVEIVKQKRAHVMQIMQLRMQGVSLKGAKLLVRDNNGKMRVALKIRKKGQRND